MQIPTVCTLGLFIPKYMYVHSITFPCSVLPRGKSASTTTPYFYTCTRSSLCQSSTAILPVMHKVGDWGRRSYCNAVLDGGMYRHTYRLMSPVLRTESSEWLSAASIAIRDDPARKMNALRSLGLAVLGDRCNISAENHSIKLR